MKRAFAAALLAAAAPAWAGERDLCAERPGLNTPPCVLDRGRVQIETALGDWTLDRDTGTRTDTVLLGNTLVRYGLSDRVELQVGWTPLGWQRARAGPAVGHATRTGDVTLGDKINLAHPDGSGFSAAVKPTVSLPVGGTPIGAGDWGASLILPLSLGLSDRVQLAVTPEVDAAVDGDGSGRHLAYGGAVGLGIALGASMSTALEIQALRDRDPAGHTTQSYAGQSGAWRPSRNVQIDLGAAAGLNTASSDVRVYAGVSKRF